MLVRIQYRVSFGLLLQPKVRHTEKIIRSFSENLGKSPEICMNGQDCEGTGNVCFKRPSSMVCQVDKSDGVVNNSKLCGKIWISISE